MGVGGLWSLLSSVGKEVNLEQCRGKKLAVDLSDWIIQCSSAPTGKPIPASYLCCRGIFMRTLNLLSLGISLVFVIDGPNPPVLKKRTKNREEFYHVALEYKELLTALGLPVLECDGEAEKMCAELNHLKKVDGVITNDGDALIYGAQTVYKGLLQEKKEHIATVYHMEDITTDLHLTKRDLVAFALLSVGDLCDGVPNVREKKFADLMKEFKTNNIEDALDRLKSWTSNSELDVLDNKKASLTVNKKRHCGKCLHEGTKQEHVHSGCTYCQMGSDCKESTTLDHPSCLCEYHMMDGTVQAYKTELKIRELALKSHPHFPDQAVIQEFLEPLPETSSEMDLSLCLPNFQAVCTIIEKRLHYPITQTMSYLVPATIKMAFHGLLPNLTISPLRIVKACKHKSEQCFMIEWQKLGSIHLLKTPSWRNLYRAARKFFETWANEIHPSRKAHRIWEYQPKGTPIWINQDTFSDESSYTFRLSQNMFSSKYPEMVNQFMRTSNCAVKRKFNNLKQTKMTSLYKIVKQPEFQK